MAYASSRSSPTTWPTELRAPICNLLVRNQVLLSQHRDSAAYREALESNAEELERLSRIVTDMLFLVQVDNPAIQAQFGCVALHEQAAKVIDLYEMVAEDKGVELRLSGSGFAHGDNLMIQRAISNLVSNAVRHTPQGRAHRRADRGARGHTEVRGQQRRPGHPRRSTCRTCSSASTAAPDARLEPGRHRPGTGHRAIDHGLPRRPRRSGKRTAQKTHLRLLFPSTGAAFRRRFQQPARRRHSRYSPQKPARNSARPSASRVQGVRSGAELATDRRAAGSKHCSSAQNIAATPPSMARRQQPAEPVASARGTFRKLPRHVFTSTSAAVL